MPSGVYKHKKMTPEHKLKISLANKWKSKQKLTDEHKKNISKACKWRIPWNKWKKWLQVAWNKWIKHEKVSWEKNFNWKWWITPERNAIRQSLEYKIWERSVIELWDFTCAKCNSKLKRYRLVAHHILNFSSNEDVRFNINNWITFCKDCHKDFHKIYWKKNNNEKQLKEFLWVK